MKSTLAPPVTSTRPESRSERIRLARAATGLNPAEKLLLRTLVDFMGDASECWPALPRLAAEVGVSARHLRRMLRSLEAAGWICTEYRFRPDRSQTSCLYRWAKAPDLHVRPPRTSASPLEVNIGSIQGIKTHASDAECGFELRTEMPIAVPVAAELEEKQTGKKISPSVIPDPVLSDTPAAAVADLVTDKTVAEVQERPPVAVRKPSPRFIVIDGSRFLDINHGRDISLAAVGGKLLNSGTVDRLAFFACWCAIAAKLRAGKVQFPERMMRFLLDNRKAMDAYPDQAAEQKARAAIRHLWPDKPYNPHG